MTMTFYINIIWLCVLVLALIFIYTKILKQLFKKPILNNMRGKTVVHFTTHGCQGIIHEFDYVGIIVGYEFKNKHKFYIVRVLKDRSGGEKRNNNLICEYESVLDKYLQNIGGDFYVAYD